MNSMNEPTLEEDVQKLFTMIAERIDQQSERILAICAVLVAKGVCTADELKQAIEKVKKP